MPKRKGRTESKTSPRRIEAKKKQAKALELRKGGASYEIIAQMVPYKSAQAAHNAVDRVLRAMVIPLAEDVGKLELERLDMMFVALLPKIRAGDPEAIRAGIRIMDRRAKYLGLDAPLKISATVSPVKPFAEYTNEELAWAWENKQPIEARLTEGK